MYSIERLTPNCLKSNPVASRASPDQIFSTKKVRRWLKILLFVLNWANENKDFMFRDSFTYPVQFLKEKSIIIFMNNFYERISFFWTEQDAKKIQEKLKFILFCSIQTEWYAPFCKFFFAKRFKPGE